MKSTAVAPVVLTGRFIRLDPLSRAQVPALAGAAADPEIWRYTRNAPLTTVELMETHVEELLRAQAAGTDLPFATFHHRAATYVGMTRFMDIQHFNRMVEIGGTFLNPAFHHTGANLEAKLLMLSHAFETWDCLRVQFKTDSRNISSQKAIEKLGAVREGVLRDHMVLDNGYVRSSVYYSILAAEWPAVKEKLLARLQPLWQA